MVARRRPGDKIDVAFKRNGDKKNTALTLIKKDDLVVTRTPEEIQLSYEIEGAKFVSINDEIRKQLRIEGGVQLLELADGAWREAGLKEGFVITKVGDSDIDSLEEFQRLVDSKSRDFYVMGKTPDGEKDYFRIDW